MRAIPDADGLARARSSQRLTLALLGYFVLITLVITLSPFDFGPPRFRLSFLLKPSDVLLNILMFLPIGFLLRSLGGNAKYASWHALALAACFSLLIETTQIFIRGRFVSPIDVFTNTLGGALGVLVRSRAERWALCQPQTIGRTGLDIPLVGLVYLLVPQLWLSSVGLVEDAWRSVTTLLLGCAGGIVLAALHRHHWQGGVRVAANVVPPLAALWLMVGALPALAASPLVFGAMAVLAVAVTWWLASEPTAAGGRRFEADTLQRFLPVFAVYLVVAALWPPMRPIVEWHGAIGFLGRIAHTKVVDIMLLLEQVGGFTLLGYALAELKGRDEISLAADLPRITLMALLFAVMLEAAQGLLAGPGASVVRALLATAGAIYGAAVYHLARTHVRSLRASIPARETSLAA